MGELYVIFIVVPQIVFHCFSIPTPRIFIRCSLKIYMNKIYLKIGKKNIIEYE